MHPVGFGDGAVSQPPIHGVDAADEGGLPFASFFESEVGQKLDIAVGDIRQRLGGRTGISGRHVGYAIMDHALLDVNGIEMSGGP